MVEEEEDDDEVEGKKGREGHGVPRQTLDEDPF